MKRNLLLLSTLIGFCLFTLSLPQIALADSSHARIVRLSLIQGDVRFASQFHDDAVTDSKAIWEVAQLNLPIRQGNALSTGNGRAQVEFENGAMAFLGSNTVVEFYDLSLNDGDKITRLILRQGSASFHERSQATDYFSVTGGDFSVAVDGHATFRLENFDDGSSVNVLSGRVQVLQNDKSTPLEKGQALSVHAQDGEKQIIGRAPPNDDFDRWVNTRIQNAEVVNSQVPTYGNSYNSYVAGYSDLYTYGSWMSVGGFNCWRPFGVGLGWSPFDSGFGNWYFDQGGLGWSFLGTSPWGWLPYHYGGWMVAPGYGWVWNPGGLFMGRPQPYHPVTGVFVRAGNTVGVVPMNVADKPGKTALNLNQGVYPVQSGVVSRSVVAANNEKWSVQKNNSQVAGFTSAIAPTAAPSRLSRTITAVNSPAAGSSFGRGSSIAYDRDQHRFVNASMVNSAQARVGQASGQAVGTKTNGKNSAQAGPARVGVSQMNNPAAVRNTNVAAPRASSLPPRPSAMPAPARPSGGASGASASRGSWGGGRAGSSMGSMGSAGSSGSGSARPSSSASTGGGRPH
jgi:FecR protein